MSSQSHTSNFSLVHSSLTCPKRPTVALVSARQRLRFFLLFTTRFLKKSRSRRMNDVLYIINGYSDGLYLRNELRYQRGTKSIFKSILSTIFWVYFHKILLNILRYICETKLTFYSVYYLHIRCKETVISILWMFKRLIKDLESLFQLYL